MCTCGWWVIAEPQLCSMAVMPILAPRCLGSAAIVSVASAAGLIIAGTDDPIVPVVNARVMARLLPNSTLHLHPGGHIDVVANAAEFAPVIESFRADDSDGQQRSSDRAS